MKDKSKQRNTGNQMDVSRRESNGNNSLLAEAFLFWEQEGCAEWTKYVYFGKRILCLGKA